MEFRLVLYSSTCSCVGSLPLAANTPGLGFIDRLDPLAHWRYTIFHCVVPAQAEKMKIVLKPIDHVTTGSSVRGKEKYQ